MITKTANLNQAKRLLDLWSSTSAESIEIDSLKMEITLLPYMAGQ